MDYVSLLNQVWQKQVNSVQEGSLAPIRPTFAYRPVQGNLQYPIKWRCIFTFAGYAGTATEPTKALAKQEAARQVCLRLQDDGRLDGFELRLRYSTAFQRNRYDASKSYFYTKTPSSSEE
uniref:ORF4a protein n=1 Tax=Bat Coronavirus PaJX20 TaxID=3018874 RepID=A0AA49EEN9_9NIDO|nr:ORF4a protein [Bat Coronavirus PaJX20]